MAVIHGAANAGYQPGETEDPAIVAVAAAAAGLIRDGARIGLGSGRASRAFIAALGVCCREGLRVSGVATSRRSADLARGVGIPLINLGAGGPLDCTVDGADEVTPNLDLIKGGGGSLVDERIVASASLGQIILVGAEKLVRALGERHPVPVEVIPLAEWLVTRQLVLLDLTPVRRADAGGTLPFRSDNGNIILDCAVPHPLDAAAARQLHQAIRGIVGVVDTGLFLGTASMVLVGYPDGHVETLRPVDSSSATLPPS